MTETPPVTPGPRRWIMSVLLLSLATNLLIVGVVVGAMLSPDGPRRTDGDQRAVRGLIGEPFVRALPTDMRRALIRDVVQNRSQFRESRESLRQRFEAFLAALRAETFDVEEATRLLGEQRNAAIRRQELGEQLLLNRLTEMTFEERAAYADALEDALKQLRRR